MKRTFVFVAWAVAPGGTLSVMRALWPRLERHGRVQVLARGPNHASIVAPVRRIGGRGNPLRFPGIWAYFAAVAWSSIRAARTAPGAVLIPQDSLATGAAAALAGRLAGRPVVVMEHGTASAIAGDYFWQRRFPPSGRLGKLRHRLLRWSVQLLHRVCIRYATWVLIAGDEEEQAWRSRGFDPARIIRYGFPVDLDRFRPAPADERTALRESLGIPRGRVLVVSVSRLAAEKGLDDLIDALAMAGGREAATLVLAGDGPQRDELEAAAQASGLDVRFLGAIDASQVGDLLRAADIFVYAGLQGANTPYAVLEAMASGLAVIATTAPAIHGRMLDNGRGLAVAPGDRQALAAAIGSLLDDSQRRRAMGEAARAYVAEHHAADALDRAVDQLLRRLSTGSGVSA